MDAVGIAALVAQHTHDPTAGARAVAVALAESDGNTSSRCYNRRNSVGRVVCGQPGPGVISTDRGLWQINDRAHPTVSDAAADDPAQATAYAAKISRSFQNMSPWVAYKTGSYRRRLPEAQKAWATVAAGGGAAGAAGAAGAVMAAPGGAVVAQPAGFGGLGDLSVLTTRKTWGRVAQVVGGGACIVMGLVILNKDLAISVIGTAATGGASKVVGAAATAAAAAA